MPDWLPSVLGIITSIGAAYFSAKWATRRAFQERWWTRKEQAYSEIIESLHDMIRYSDLVAEEYLNTDRGEHSKKKEFGDKYTEAYWKIQKATDIGAFIISPKAAAILVELRKRPKLNWEENPMWEVYEEDSKQYRSALEGIRFCAHKDLKI
jgi:hypothetical protein